MPDQTARAEAQRIIAENRKALHDFHILETFEAGEVWVYNVHISPYANRGYADHEPTRRRKLLLHRQEIRKLIGRTVERGMTLVPLRLYYKGGRIKLAVSLAKGKQSHDKREAIRKREVDRETRAAMKNRRR